MALRAPLIKRLCSVNLSSFISTLAHFSVVVGFFPHPPPLQRYMKHFCHEAESFVHLSRTIDEDS